ncbi:complement decay-accelerating factor-like isoform X2 [Antechinus flavipes]|uniref:complement decay-accelerating factor-like isoform X2 n=1 Tax=Antechinus flavipes TaxID=38775 RepID=UPI00223641F1|nr:complement decay-accelerating factor-like isoform X2 [Antechinus flavipes]
MGAYARRGTGLPSVALLWALTLLAVPRVRGDCSTLPTFQNAHPAENYDANKAFVDGTTITYRCDTGYVKIPGKSDSVTCKGVEWSEIPQFCDRSCDAPKLFLTMQLDATFINKNNFPINSSVTFVCRPGYTLSKFGKLISTCQQNGSWSPVSGSCKKKSCPNPESLDNGRVEILTDILFGSEIEYSCEEGYTLIGDNIRLCEIAGNKVVWSGDVPFCKVNTCVPPPDIQNGEHSGAGKDLFSYGETVTYRCDSSVRDRFSLIGNNTIFCDKDGQWNTVPPQCKEVRCETPQVDNAVPISGFGRFYTYKDTIIFECEKGYILQSNNKITCEADNNWSPALPVCYKVNTCVPPPDIQNGEHSGAGKDLFSYGETVTYRCDSSVRDRFSLIGNNTIFCDKDGQWNTVPPQCKEVRCETPQVDNAVPVSGFVRSYTYRDTIIFECEKGYFLQSNNKITCEADNNWSPALPVCYKESSVPPKKESQGLDPGIIILIVIIVVIALVIIIVIIYRQ